jgi:predicted histone-like DNA-binding protein
MPLKFKVVKQATPGIKGGGTYKYYPRITGREKASLREVCNSISEASTFSSVDILGAAEAFLVYVGNLLLEGKNVYLDEFGIFSLTLTTTPEDEAENVTAKNIKKINIQYKPGKEMKKKLLHAKFTKVPD